MPISKEQSQQPTEESQSAVTTENATIATGLLGSVDDTDANDADSVLDRIFYGPSEYRI